jgi:hypothetical protein|tara:strand:- start:1013 stop:2113 length:1101 start_codon:yes stop_codon:yes gene_type:complete
MVKKIRLYVFGYRDQSFWCEYGPVVRDLMIVSALCELDVVDSVEFYNRPVTWPEILLRRKKIGYPDVGSKKITFMSKLSFDVFGPLRKRLWVKDAYNIHYNTQPDFSGDYINVVLDFLPIGELPAWIGEADVYWYDLIDNFTKHNRYTEAEKKQVSKKYQSIAKYAGNNLVTGVSASALSEFSNAHVLENAILKLPKIIKGAESSMFDFGFMGFMSNKFDIDAVKKICTLGYSVAIYGEFYDKDTEKELLKVSGAKLFGRFRDTDVDMLLSTFRIGLIPYKNELLHDESPLKLYQYLSAFKLVLSSFDFDFKHDMFYVYDANDFESKVSSVMLDLDENKTLSESEMYQFTWECRVQSIVRFLVSSK